jgi:hypothetical protein
LSHVTREVLGPSRATKLEPLCGPMYSWKSNGSQAFGSPGLKATVFGVSVTVSGSELGPKPIEMPHAEPVSDTGV